MLFPTTLASSVPLVLAFLSLACADFPPFSSDQAAQEGKFGPYTRQSYISDPDVFGPVANVLIPPQEGVSPSRYVGWAPLGPRLPTSAPMLIDANTFSTVWSGPSLGKQTYGPTVQSCNGSSYLTWWTGSPYHSVYGRGSYIFANSKYEIVYNITTAAPLKGADIHDMFITPQCTAIVIAYVFQRHDIPEAANTLISDSHFQEIDLATGKLLFHWQASKHMDITAEVPFPLTPWQGEKRPSYLDWFHINSVAKDRLGNYLVSARHTCTVYYLDGADGSVLWRLGGRNNDFKDLSAGKATDFCAQHHARWVDEDLTRISFFDNSHSEKKYLADDKHRTSRGMVVKIDQAKKEVVLERSHSATHAIKSNRKGSMQVLLDSPGSETAMVGYGMDPAWTEFSADGSILLDVAFGPTGKDRDTADNYRALKVNWTGLPYWAPKIAPGPQPLYTFNATHRDTFSVQLHDGYGQISRNDTVYFSWNGATEIEDWIILGSNYTMNLTISDHVIGIVPKTGFEDNFYVGDTQYVTVLAVDTNDRILGATDLLQMASFVLSIGLAGPHGNDTEGLTLLWQDIDETQADSACVRTIVLVFVSFVVLTIAYRHMRKGRWDVIRRVVDLLHQSVPQKYCRLAPDNGEHGKKTFNDRWRAYLRFGYYEKIPTSYSPRSHPTYV